MRSSGDGTAGGAPGRGLGESGPYPLHGNAADHVPRRPTAVPGEEGAVSEEIGYRGPTACAAAGITYRQLDYWARTGLVEPSVRPAYGSGTQRLYSFRDVVVLKIVKRFLDTGVSLQNIRTTVQHLRERGFRDLERMTLMSDGATVYECTSPDEVHALLQGGQGSSGSPWAWCGGMSRARSHSCTASEWTPVRRSSGTTPRTSWRDGAIARSDERNRAEQSGTD